MTACQTARPNAFSDSVRNQLSHYVICSAALVPPRISDLSAYNRSFPSKGKCCVDRLRPPPRKQTLVRVYECPRPSARSKADLINPLFEQRHWRADAVAGGDGFSSCPNSSYWTLSGQPAARDRSLARWRKLWMTLRVSVMPHPPLSSSSRKKRIRRLLAASLVRLSVPAVSGNSLPLIVLWEVRQQVRAAVARGARIDRFFDRR